jgi:hypothetical protein
LMIDIVPGSRNFPHLWLDSKCQNVNFIVAS